MSVIAICSNYNRPNERWWLPNGEPTIQLAGPKNWARGDDAQNSLLIALRVAPASTSIEGLKVEINQAYVQVVYGLKENERVKEIGRDANILYLSGAIDVKQESFKITCTGSTAHWTVLGHVRDWAKRRKSGVFFTHAWRRNEHIYALTYQADDIEYRIKDLDPAAKERVSTRISWTHDRKRFLEVHSLEHSVELDVNETGETTNEFNDRISQGLNHVLELKPRKIVSIDDLPAYPTKTQSE